MTKSTTPILDEAAIAEIEAHLKRWERGEVSRQTFPVSWSRASALCATVHAERERADSNYAAYDRVKGLYSDTVNQLKQVARERDEARAENEVYKAADYSALTSDVDSFRSRAVALCRDKATEWRGEAARGQTDYARACREKAVLLVELAAEMEQLSGRCL